MEGRNNKWGILYCPRHGMTKNPRRRWERIERLLRSRNIDFDYVQSENAKSVDRLVMMMINNG